MQRYICIFLLLFSMHALWAQQDLSVHFMPRTYQVMHTNPAMMLPYRVSITLPTPALALAQNAFTAKQLLRPIPGTDSLMIDVDNVLNGIGEYNYLRFNSQIDLLGLALRFGKLQLSLSTAAKVGAFFHYPKPLLNLIWEGNAPYIGQTLEIGPDIQAYAYSEIALGGAYQVSENLNVGLRLKYLNGIANLSTLQRSITFTTQDEYYQLLSTVNYQLQTSVVSFGDLEDFEFSFEPQAFSGNSGLAIDLGGTYNLGKRWSFAASLTDLGYINWKEAASTYDVEADLTFEGIDAAALVLGDTTAMQNLMDSLLQDFSATQHPGSYKTNTPAQLYLSATFTPIESLRLSALFYNEFYRNHSFPALALSASKDFGKVFTLGATYSLRHQSYTNLGLNMWLRLGPFAGFIATDNVLAPIFPMAHKQFNLRFGTSLLIGKINDQKVGSWQQ